LELPLSVFEGIIEKRLIGMRKQQISGDQPNGKYSTSFYDQFSISRQHFFGKNFR
jgi:hypothetical protein